MTSHLESVRTLSKIFARILQAPQRIVGSGYIEHPPQVPFAGQIVMQPTTLAHEDVPEWFAGQSQQHSSGGAAGGNGGGRGSAPHVNPGRAVGGHRGYRSANGYENPRPYPQGRAPGYHPHSQQPGHHAQRPHQTQHGGPHMQQQQRPPAKVIPVTVAVPQQRPFSNGPSALPRAGTVPVHPTPPSQPPAVANAVIPQLPAAAPRVTAAPPVDPSVEEDKKLSKAAKAKLRKKKREGKV
jgi:hypothetical protein